MATEAHRLTRKCRRWKCQCISKYSQTIACLMMLKGML